MIYLFIASLIAACVAGYFAWKSRIEANDLKKQVREHPFYEEDGYE